MKRYIKAAILDISNESFDAKLEIAKDPNTPSDILAELAIIDDYSKPTFSDTGELLEAIAKNPNTPAET